MFGQTQSQSCMGLWVRAVTATSLPTSARKHKVWEGDPQRYAVAYSVSPGWDRSQWLDSKGLLAVSLTALTRPFCTGASSPFAEQLLCGNLIGGRAQLPWGVLQGWVETAGADKKDSLELAERLAGCANHRLQI